MAPIESTMVIRHAESYEDVDPNIKSILDDTEIELTENGIKDAKDLAERFRKEFANFDKITIFVSPYKRTTQTAEIILDTLKDPRIKMEIEMSLRSINMGNINQENAKKVEEERYRIGSLKYKFEGGDDSSLYVSSIYDFVNKLVMDKHVKSNLKECVLIITHGFPLRLVVKAFTEMTDEDFKWIKNPPNSYIARIYFDPITGSFVVAEPMQKIKPAVQ